MLQGRNEMRQYSEWQQREAHRLFSKTSKTLPRQAKRLFHQFPVNLVKALLQVLHSLHSLPSLHSTHTHIHTWNVLTLKCVPLIVSTFSKDQMQWSVDLPGTGELRWEVLLSTFGSSSCSASSDSCDDSSGTHGIPWLKLPWQEESKSWELFRGETLHDNHDTVRPFLTCNQTCMIRYDAQIQLGQFLWSTTECHQNARFVESSLHYFVIFIFYMAHDFWLRRTWHRWKTRSLPSWSRTFRCHVGVTLCFEPFEPCPTLPWNCPFRCAIRCMQKGHGRNFSIFNSLQHSAVHLAFGLQAQSRLCKAGWCKRLVCRKSGACRS